MWIVLLLDREFKPDVAEMGMKYPESVELLDFWVALSNSEQRWVLRWGCTLSMRGRITRDGWYGVSDVDLLSCQVDLALSMTCIWAFFFRLP
ncbi:hypothetical protein H9L39_08954 [Fusarium oxysporum f. sp. albedinis]|nr:hypothetical protein H9L39_08954 [Fusarium oxysporum f. sp. albedinis]